MPSPFALLKQAIQLFISNFGYLLKFWLMLIGVTIVSLALVVIPLVATGAFQILSGELTQSLNTTPALLLIIFAPLAVVVSVWLTAGMYSLMKTVIEGIKLPIKDLLKQGWSLLLKLSLTTLLAGIIITLGLILLIIPGVVLAVWFWLTIPILLFEGRWGWSALMRSKEMVKSRFWQALWYAAFPTVVIIVLQLLVGLVPGTFADVVFSIASIPIGIITILYLFLAYKAFTKAVA